jgi:hypothetical protein
MTYREFDNKCAEVADKMAEIGEKTVYAIIIIATAFSFMIMRAEAQYLPTQQPTKHYKVEQHYNVFTGQFESKFVEDRGLWGTGYSDVTRHETRTNPFTGQKYVESTTQTVPNDALGQPIKPLPDVLDIFNQ